MQSETPFQINIPEDQIELLKTKLTLTVFPDELKNAGLDYGAPLDDMRRLVSRWKDGYQWRKHEAALNADLPQFTRDIEIDGFGPLNVHYVHKRSDVTNAVPLLFVHGWPGSFIEVRKILPLLVNASPDQPSFHVVALGLPGFGFSQAPTKKGFELQQFAELGNKLMIALGYNEYVTQGGDWGHVITRTIAQNYGKTHSKAWHSNFPLGVPPTFTTKPLLYLASLVSKQSSEDKVALARTNWYLNVSSGYFKQQSTKPQTLGYGLTDSPVALLAWIYEKLVVWTDNYAWDDDEVLTWISIYWFSRAGPAASLRIYYEVVQKNPDILTSADITPIPLGYSHFPQEVVKPPRSWLKPPNLVFESRHERGGHFGAYEKPEELVQDLRKMFGKNGPAFKVVPEKSGYDDERNNP